MKIKTAVLGCLMVLTVLFLSHQYSMAQMKPNDSSLPIGIVDVRRALRECKATE
jgi:hypothetical protein